VSESTEASQDERTLGSENPYHSHVSPTESIQSKRRRTLRQSVVLGACACSSAPLVTYGGTRAYEFLSGLRPWSDLSNQLVILGSLIALFGIVGGLIGGVIRMLGYLLLSDK
jgi:hypothetical protein